MGTGSAAVRGPCPSLPEELDSEELDSDELASEELGRDNLVSVASPAPGLRAPSLRSIPPPRPLRRPALRTKCLQCA